MRCLGCCAEMQLIEVIKDASRRQGGADRNFADDTARIAYARYSVRRCYSVRRWRRGASKCVDRSDRDAPHCPPSALIGQTGWIE